jgi:heme exporter protein A
VTATLAQCECPTDGSCAPAAASAVCVSGLSKWFDDRPVLQDIGLDIPAGLAVALMGANGAGKSTLLKVLAGLVPPDRGQVRLFGQAMGPHGAELRRRIGMIAHQPMLYRDLTARENLELFGGLYGLSQPRRRAGELLERVGLSDRAGDPVKNLSRGMTQRVAIARALVHDPDLLLADEPLEGLDHPSARAVEALLGELRSEGKTLLVSNHDVERSLGWTDRAVVLRGGRVVLDRPTSSLDAVAVLKEIGAE